MNDSLRPFSMVENYCSTQPDRHATTQRFPLVFTHIPKAAGTTVESVLRATTQYLQRKFLRLKGPLYHRAFAPGKTPILAQLAVLNRGDFADVDVLSGHLPFGIDEFFDRPCHYCSVMREPIARCQSHFKMGVRRRLWDNEADIESLFNKGDIPDNAMTRQFAGLRSTDIRCDQSMLELALENINKRYDVIGAGDSIEGVNLFLSMLSGLYNWPTILFEHYNVARQTWQFDEETIEKIRNANQFDQLLYQRLFTDDSIWVADHLRPILTTNKQKLSKASENILVISPTLNQSEQAVLINDHEFQQVLNQHQHLEQLITFY